MFDLLTTVVLVTLIALVFDFINGFHDAANSIATVVSTRVLSPLQAVTLAALLNFAGAFIFTTAVATTVGKGIVDPSIVTIQLIAAALAGAIVWGILTWIWGLPTSSSHALIGGLIGAAFVSSGFSSINFYGILKIVAFIFIAPAIGLVFAIIFIIIIMWMFSRSKPSKINRFFKKLQIVSAGFYSLGHGTNDAQKTMGIITLILFTAGYLSTFAVPIWIVLMCHATIALGTFFGGWRIVKTMGSKITKLKPVDGFAAETAGGTVLAGTAIMGIPVSTTHVIAGAIMGVGSVRHASQVRWQVARKIALAWIITIPAAALVSALSYLLIELFKPLL